MPECLFYTLQNSAETKNKLLKNRPLYKEILFLAFNRKYRADTYRGFLPSTKFHTLGNG